MRSYGVIIITCILPTNDDMLNLGKVTLGTGVFEPFSMTLWKKKGLGGPFAGERKPSTYITGPIMNP
jgi:hypothetical protein